MCRSVGLVQFDHMTVIMKLTTYHLQQTDSTVTNDMQPTRFYVQTTFSSRFTSDCPMKSLTLSDFLRLPDHPI